MPLFFTLQQNSNNSATLSNVNFKDNFTGLNQGYSRVNGTNNQDFSIKPPILKKKRKRLSIKEECIECEKLDGDFKKNSLQDKTKKNIVQPNITGSYNQDTNIPLNNTIVPVQNYYLFAENLKHLKKQEYVQQFPVFFPHNIGGVPGFTPFNVNPEFNRPFNFGKPQLNHKCICFDRDGNPYYLI
jgi:hypothetical protein